MNHLVLENDFLELELIDPSRNESLGNRFCGGGWIRTMRRRVSRLGYFEDESIHPERLEFGCPIEFIQPLPLDLISSDAQEQIKIGVGKTRHHSATSRFEDHLLKPYPWRVIPNDRPGAAGVRFIQRSEPESGYEYVLEIRVALCGETVLIDLDLCNTGRRQLDTCFYLHPFFCEHFSEASCWFEVPRYVQDRRGIRQLLSGRESFDCFPAPDTLVRELNPSISSQWIETGNIETGDTFRIVADRPFDRINFWRKPGLCYAIEPMFDVSLAAGQRMNCRLKLEAGFEKKTEKRRLVIDEAHG